MRIRTIKPEFWSHRMHESISETSSLVALGLLNIADDEGRFLANARIIECTLFPARKPKRKVRSCLDELESCGYIIRYRAEMDGKTVDLGVVVSFNKHQVISKPYPSRLAPPPFQERSENDSRNGTGAVPGTFQSDSMLIPDKEGKGKEGKGRQQQAAVNTAAAAAVALADPGSDSQTDSQTDSRDPMWPDEGPTEPTEHPDDSTTGDPRLDLVQSLGGWLVDPNSGEVLREGWLTTLDTPTMHGTKLTEVHIREVFKQAQRLTGKGIRYPSGFLKVLELLRTERQAEAAKLDQRKTVSEAAARKAQEAAIREAEVKVQAQVLATVEAFLASPEGDPIAIAIAATPDHTKHLESARKSKGAGLGLYLLGKAYPELKAVLDQAAEVV